MELLSEWREGEGQIAIYSIENTLKLILISKYCSAWRCSPLWSPSFIVYAQRILVYCMIGSLRYRWFGYWIRLRPQRSSRQDMDLDDYADFWASVDNQTSDGCWYHWRRSVPCSCVCSMLLRLWKSAIDGARWCPSTRIRILHSFMIHFYNRTLIMTCSVHNKFMVEYIYIYT